jgi:uncharacterized protein
LVHYTSFSDFYEAITQKEKEIGLCRMIAGYSWPWISKKNNKLFDIQIEGINLQWNNTHVDWINSANPNTEVGCIHTTQGYDLNYSGIIFGKEITYNKKLNRIEIIEKNYFDRNGSVGINNPEKLKEYIVNIYKTMMYRGIKGTYIYACDPEMRAYLSRVIKTNVDKMNMKQFDILKILDFENVKPYKNAIPLVDIQAAAGNFSDLQSHSDLIWVEPPYGVKPEVGSFICKVVGESMNRKIPNGTYCLFKKDEGGSRNGKIVLVESTSINDSEFGSGYTVKEYHSVKNVNNEIWEHESIILKPLSNFEEYENIVLFDDDLINFRVVGIFDRVIE